MADVTYLRTTDERPYDSVLFCPICGIEVHVARARAGETMGIADPYEAEAAATAHMSTEHPGVTIDDLRRLVGCPA